MSTNFSPEEEINKYQSYIDVPQYGQSLMILPTMLMTVLKMAPPYAVHALSINSSRSKNHCLSMVDEKGYSFKYRFQFDIAQYRVNRFQYGMYRIQDTVFILNPVRYTVPVSYGMIPVRYRYRTVFRYTVAPLLIRHFFMQGRLRKKEARDFKYLPLKMLWIKLFIKTFIGRGLS